ncbi:hypothetical protein [Pseudoalteromonas luteoviolacea]|uniref:hypothetical protein n=1 Tax=Pseudoalteromonas luteoviolacea TaxID=43657 RepID=UPI001B366193|nr:hypothetical protein [Pseudoalteromonas luteoviolacea]MBQ4834867.1 hypothetical protein [Pseudoalteromonas luteoviolacea]
MRLITLIQVLLFIFPSLVYSKSTIESSLTIDLYSKKSVVDGSFIVSEMVRNGYFHIEPTQRVDYTSYYFPIRNIKVLGYDLVYFNYEHMEKYVGCCVNRGTSVVLYIKSGQSQQKLEQFAKTNLCEIKSAEWIYTPKSIKELLIQKEVNLSNLVELSCKETDRVYAEST